MKLDMTDEEILSEMPLVECVLCEMIESISDDNLRAGIIYATLKLLFKTDPSSFLETMSMIMDECIKEASK